MTTDQIADMLTRIRNAQLSKHPAVNIPASGTKEAILEVLVEEGFVARVERVKDAEDKDSLKVYLKYGSDNRPAITEVKRLSKPGKRVYVGSGEIPSVRGGLGSIVVSTSQGMMSGRQAKKAGVGGELICSIF